MAAGQEPSGWELLRALEALQAATRDDLDQLVDRYRAELAALAARVAGLEGGKKDSAQFRRSITIAATAAVIASSLSLATSLILHFAFT